MLTLKRKERADLLRLVVLAALAIIAVGAPYLIVAVAR